jgi:hypothetical protein
MPEKLWHEFSHPHQASFRQEVPPIGEVRRRAPIVCNYCRERKVSYSLPAAHTKPSLYRFIAMNLGSYVSFGPHAQNQQAIEYNPEIASKAFGCLTMAANPVSKGTNSSTVVSAACISTVDGKLANRRYIFFGCLGITRTCWGLRRRLYSLTF